MIKQEGFLKKGEQTVYLLRSLFEQYGYRKFKMSKFEEYDFYADNRSFLSAENILTFNGLKGRLLALKPDVTLSIVKNTRGNRDCPERVYYTENVYRAEKGDGEYREMMQVGLEYIGDVDDYAVCEIILLAKKSLDSISARSVLDISHMGFVSGLMEAAEISPSKQGRILACMGEKNPHGIRQLCREAGVSEEMTERIAQTAELGGSLEETLPQAKALCCNEKMEQAVAELEKLLACLKACVYDQGVNLDFSVVNDMDYYNGIIFQGFVDGIPKKILFGGRYDKLLEKFGKDAGAMGFAVAMDLLERYGETEKTYDVDALLLYDDTTDTIAKMRAVQMLQNMGLSVAAQKKDDGSITYKQLCRLNERGVEVIG